MEYIKLNFALRNIYSLSHNIIYKCNNIKNNLNCILKKNNSIQLPNSHWILHTTRKLTCVPYVYVSKFKGPLYYSTKIFNYYNHCNLRTIFLLSFSIPFFNSEPKKVDPEEEIITTMKYAILAFEVRFIFEHKINGLLFLNSEKTNDNLS